MSRYLILDYRTSPPTISTTTAGEIGESRAVSLKVYTEPDVDVASYTMWFTVEGGLLPSAVYDAADELTIPLSYELTQQEELECQLVGLSVANESGEAEIISKTPIVKLFFGESLSGTVVVDPETGDTLFNQIADFKAKLTEVEEVVEKADLTKYRLVSESYSADETDTLLAEKADNDKVYSKEDTDTKLSAKQDIISAGDGIEIADNKVSAKVATNSTLGSVIVGEGINLAEDGTVSVDIPDSEVFIAQKGVTKFDEIKEAYLAGKIVVFKWTDEATSINTRTHLDMMDYIDLTNQKAYCYTMIYKQMWTVTCSGPGAIWGYSSTDFYTASDVTKLLKDKQDIITTSSKLSTDLIENKAGYITSSALEGYATEEWVEGKGYVDNTYHDTTKQDVLTEDNQGANITITNESGVVKISASGGTDLPIASDAVLGGVKIGDNLSITDEGVLSAEESYELPIASAEVLGGIKIGDNLDIDDDGVVSAQSDSVIITVKNQHCELTSEELLNLIDNGSNNLIVRYITSSKDKYYHCAGAFNYGNRPIFPCIKEYSLTDSSITFDLIMFLDDVGGGSTCNIMTETVGNSGYTLPVATKNKLGGIMIGDNLTITDTGVLSATTGGSTVIEIADDTCTLSLDELESIINNGSNNIIVHYVKATSEIDMYYHCAGAYMGQVTSYDDKTRFAIFPFIEDFDKATNKSFTLSAITLSYIEDSTATHADFHSVKMDKLTVDDTVKISDNPVSGTAVINYHDSTKADVFTIDEEVTETSSNPVSSKAVATYHDTTKMDTASNTGTKGQVLTKTDDGAEWADASGGSGGINYSTDEQDTGLTWVDGSTIYQRTWVKNGIYTTDTIDSSFTSTLYNPIGYEGIWGINDYRFDLNTYYNSGAKYISVFVDSAGLRLRSNISSYESTSYVAVTVKYTKA